MSSIANWKPLAQKDVSNIAPKNVIVNQGKSYDTLLIASNNTNQFAINTVNAMVSLAQYYQSQGITTVVYGISATSGNLNGPTFTALGWNQNQCNPMLTWVSQGKINPVWISHGGAGYTASELDTMIRSAQFHDPALDTIPVMPTTTPMAMSKFENIQIDPQIDSQQGEAQGNNTQIRTLIIIMVVLIVMYQMNKNR